MDARTLWRVVAVVIVVVALIPLVLFVGGWFPTWTEGPVYTPGS